MLYFVEQNWQEYSGQIQPEEYSRALMFLKAYASEHNGCALINADEKSYRQWSCKLYELIAELKIVSLKFLKLLAARDKPYGDYLEQST